eukprot:763318-Hanusia_phi.AAC.4
MGGKLEEEVEEEEKETGKVRNKYEQKQELAKHKQGDPGKGEVKANVQNVNATSSFFNFSTCRSSEELISSDKSSEIVIESDESDAGDEKMSQDSSSVEGEDDNKGEALLAASRRKRTKVERVESSRSGKKPKVSERGRRKRATLLFCEEGKIDQEIKKKCGQTEAKHCGESEPCLDDMNLVGLLMDFTAVQDNKAKKASGKIADGSPRSEQRSRAKKTQRALSQVEKEMMRKMNPF